MSVNIEVEYCGTCGYADKYNDLTKYILASYPQANVTGFEGRRASFEVKINGTLVHSKLCTMAFPDFQDVTDIVSEASTGIPVRKVTKQQPITNCCVM